MMAKEIFTNVVQVVHKQNDLQLELLMPVPVDGVELMAILPT